MGDEILMDTTKQELLETTFTEKAKEIRTLNDLLSGDSEDSKTYWQSGDADSFRKAWREQYAVALDEIETALKSAASNLEASRTAIVNAQGGHGQT